MFLNFLLFDIIILKRLIMKKYLAVLSFGLILTGCANKTQNEQFKQPQKCIIDNTKAPIWVCSPQDTENFLVAVGSAKPNSAKDFQFQKEEAIAAARDELARKISVKVKNMFKQFRQTTGSGKNQVFDKVSQSVSKQLANTVLIGSKQLNIWISPEGTLFVLIGLPLNEQLRNNVKNLVNSSFKNLDAKHQQALAKEAQKELDEAVKNEF